MCSTALPVRPTRSASRWELPRLVRVRRSIDTLCRCFRHPARLEGRFKRPSLHKLLFALVSSPFGWVDPPSVFPGLPRKIPEPPPSPANESPFRHPGRWNWPRHHDRPPVASSTPLEQHSTKSSSTSANGCLPRDIPRALPSRNVREPASPTTRSSVAGTPAWTW